MLQGVGTAGQEVFGTKCPSFAGCLLLRATCIALRSQQGIFGLRQAEILWRSDFVFGVLRMYHAHP